MRSLVESLCSKPCAGRYPGSPEGAAARAVVVRAMRDAGLDCFEQVVPFCRGANVLAQIPGNVDRWVLVAAHYDHLGKSGRDVFWGADDNAAAVAILVEVGRRLARRRPEGRGVIVAAFDAEEAPFFPDRSGSQHFALRPVVPLDRIDMMVCMDLVGHALGPAALPGEVRNSLFALGSERSEGTKAHLLSLADAEKGLWVRGLDADVIPPLSDYVAFWNRRRPFLFLTSGRSRVYHTVEDTPDKLDYPKMARIARWLERFVRETCKRDEARILFREGIYDDSLSLQTIMDLSGALRAVSEEAELARGDAEALLEQCDRNGRLPKGLRGHVRTLAQAIETKLS